MNNIGEDSVSIGKSRPLFKPIKLLNLVVSPSSKTRSYNNRHLDPVLGHRVTKLETRTSLTLSSFVSNFGVKRNICNGEERYPKHNN